MKITVVGLGYVGTVAATGLASAGHDVLGVDIDRGRIDMLQGGKSPFYEAGLESRTTEALREGRIRFLHRDDVDEPLGEVAVISTGTPPLGSGAVDLHQVQSALTWIEGRGARGLVVAMKSTVPPGTGRKLVNQDLRGLGIRYVSNPEFLREGRAVQDWDSPDRIVIGAEYGDDESIETLKRMHSGIDAPYMITDVTSAEMVKYASNAFLATRISFINEISSLCDRVGASIDDVSEGLSMDERTGVKIHAGVGYGGSCFPKDVRALDYIALTSGVNVDLLRAVITVNNRQRLLPLHSLRERFNGALVGLRVSIMGLSFKPNTDDVRDAPSLGLIQALVDEGAEVLAFDPQASEAARGQLPDSVRLVDGPLEAADRAQAMVIITEWSDVVDADWEDVARCMLPPRFVFDGRNALDPGKMHRLGFEYVGIGRNHPPPPPPVLTIGNRA